MRHQVVRTVHDELGHFAVKKIPMKLNEYYPNMKNFVKAYVASCIACLANKNLADRPASYLHPIEKITVPFHTVHIDHLRPF